MELALLPGRKVYRACFDAHRHHDRNKMDLISAKFPLLNFLIISPIENAFRNHSHRIQMTFSKFDSIAHDSKKPHTAGLTAHSFPKACGIAWKSFGRILNEIGLRLGSVKVAFFHFIRLRINETGTATVPSQLAGVTRRNCFECKEKWKRKSSMVQRVTNLQADPLCFFYRALCGASRPSICYRCLRDNNENAGWCGKLWFDDRHIDWLIDGDIGESSIGLSLLINFCRMGIDFMWLFANEYFFIVESSGGGARIFSPILFEKRPSMNRLNEISKYSHIAHNKFN